MNGRRIQVADCLFNLESKLVAELGEIDADILDDGLADSEALGL